MFKYTFACLAAFFFGCYLHKPMSEEKTVTMAVSVEAVFKLRYKNHPYDVEVCYNPGKSVVGVKELIVAKLKTTYDGFESVKPGYLTFKNLDKKTLVETEIVGTRIPEGDEFFADLDERKVYMVQSPNSRTTVAVQDANNDGKISAAELETAVSSATAATDVEEEEIVMISKRGDMTKLSNQLLQYTYIKNFFSAGTYLKLCRMRMAYYLVAAFILIIIGVMSFEFSIMFNIVLSQVNSVSNWQGQLALKMICFLPFSDWRCLDL